MPTAAPSRSKILWRGITRRCARCGSGHLFQRYFKMVPDCPSCHLHFEREPGYFTGALAINVIAVGGLFTFVFVALLIATVPKIPVVPILAVLIPIVALGPIVFYPFSKTIWVSVDRAFLMRLDPNERID